ncbi:hypothetical protein N5K27_27215 [Pigmentiphaga sp. GD03639]|jgi:hypothetical protein|uniref:Recombinase-like domain-containing protein n=1 Tax=Pigmentiphaga daeguensis TaxID=414049 RepID=A0ABN1BYQ5_9BURK|nr:MULTISPECIES: recombinase-like helix-turn-helix domain-containing protein [unclassified Pigmentiphaga]MDH2239992.1 hypothetical protein [Pigmentiphaga sp. GD03639]OVZ58911.1 hypothetical protein CDO46_24410 [Pigmentiphaga sp. NML030171]
MSEFNVHLTGWKGNEPSPHAGQGVVEAPGQGVNLRWQSRESVPTDFENALADAIESAYLAGARTPQQFAEHLNAAGVAMPSGRDWSAASLEQEMSRLGY